MKSWKFHLLEISVPPFNRKYWYLSAGEGHSTNFAYIHIAFDGNEIYKSVCLALWKYKSHNDIHIYKSVLQRIYLKGETSKTWGKVHNWKCWFLREITKNGTWGREEEGNMSKSGEMMH